MKKFFIGELLHLRIRILRYPGVEGAEKTLVASHYMRLCYISAKFRLFPICLPLAELEGKMPLAADEV